MMNLNAEHHRAAQQGRHRRGASLLHPGQATGEVRPQKRREKRNKTHTQKALSFPLKINYALPGLFSKRFLRFFFWKI